VVECLVGRRRKGRDDALVYSVAGDVDSKLAGRRVCVTARAVDACTARRSKCLWQTNAPADADSDEDAVSHTYP
jgi:hypothetical protein